MDKKILIVDDEAHIRMLIGQTLEELEDEGVEFLTADNGASALELRKKAIEDGMITLRESGLHKIRAGVTTIEEVVRETVA